MGPLGFNFGYDAGAARRVGGWVALPFLVVSILMISKTRESRSAGVKFLCLSSLFFLVVLLCLWPIITSRDFLPVYPLLAILCATYLVEVENRDSGRLRFSRGPAALTLITLLGVGLTIFSGRLWRDQSRYPRQLITDVLLLTQPTDYVLDLKGESVFRRRPTKIILSCAYARETKACVVSEGFTSIRYLTTCSVSGCASTLPETTKKTRAHETFTRTCPHVDSDAAVSPV